MILGILSWWGIDLDPITMAAMIISIGFSVDIPAHVSYHYYKACKLFRFLYFFVKVLVHLKDVVSRLLLSYAFYQLTQKHVAPNR